MPSRGRIRTLCKICIPSETWILTSSGIQSCSDPANQFWIIVSRKETFCTTFQLPWARKIRWKSLLAPAQPDQNIQDHVRVSLCVSLSVSSSPKSFPASLPRFFSSSQHQGLAPSHCGFFPRHAPAQPSPSFPVPLEEPQFPLPASLLGDEQGPGLARKVSHPSGCDAPTAASCPGRKQSPDPAVLCLPGKWVNRGGLDLSGCDPCFLLQTGVNSRLELGLAGEEVTASP